MFKSKRFINFITFTFLIIFLTMKISVILLALLFIQSTYTASLPRNQLNQLTTSNNNLGFSNFTAEGVTPQMLKTYITTINDASTKYKNDIQSNARYIKQQLDKLPNPTGQSYYVFIQTTPPAKMNYGIWVSTKRVLAGLSRVNLVNPEWSYLILRTYAFLNVGSFWYMQYGLLGPAVNFGVKLAIMDIIGTFETEDSCSCSKESVTNIRATLESYFNSYQFNVLCDSNGSTAALFYGIDGMWGTFKAKCFYTIYKDR